MANVSSINGNPIVVGGTGIAKNAVTNSSISDGTISEEKIASSMAKKTATATATSPGYTFSLEHLVLYAGVAYVIKSEGFSNTATTYVRLHSGTNVATFHIPAGSTTYSVFIPSEDLFDVGIAHWFDASGSATVTLWRMEEQDAYIKHIGQLVQNEMSRTPTKIDKDWFVFGSYSSSSSFDETDGWSFQERKRICTRPVFLRAGSKITWESGSNALFVGVSVYGYKEGFLFDHTRVVYDVDWLQNGSYVVSVDGWVVVTVATANTYASSGTIVPDMFDSTMYVDMPWQSAVFETNGKNLVDIGAVVGASNAAGTAIERPVHTFDGHTLKLNWSHAKGQYWLDFGGTLPAGTYTLSCKVRYDLSVSSSYSRNILLGIASGYTYVSPKTGYEGTVIPPNVYEGYLYLTVALEKESDLRIIICPMVAAHEGAEFYEIQLEAGDAPTAFIGKYTAIDYVARSGSSGGYIKPKEVMNGSFNSSYHTGARDFADKCKQFSYLMYGDYNAQVEGPSDCESFLFFTDPHLLEGSGWESRCQEYITQIQKYYNSTPTEFCLCGGDWLGNSDLPADACFKLGYIDGFMHSMFDNCYMLVGNHDTNYQGKLTEESATYTTRLSDDAIKNLWYRSGKSYFDFTGGNTRFFCFDTGIENQAMDYAGNYGWEQARWFADELTKNGAEHLAIAAHILYYSSSIESSLQPLMSTVLQIAQSFNARKTVLVDGISYDFSSAVGKVEFGIFGHLHFDNIVTVYGIPCMVTTWARANSTDGPTFDLVLADYGNNVVKTVRIGVGDDRTMQI